jgi:voltage-gated potassium channel
MSGTRGQAREAAAGPGARWKSRTQMGFLFSSLLAIILLSPLLHSSLAGRMMIGVAFAATLLSGVYAVSDTRRHRIIALVLGIPHVVGYVISEFIDTNSNATLIVITLGVPFYLFVTYRLLMFVTRAKRVGREVLFASASVYLMFGFSWAGVYGLVEYLQPGSFTNVGLDSGAVWDTLFYFSFVTLTTLGYGDIAPISRFARHLALLEAISGVLTLSFLVARIVSAYKKEE